MRSTACLRCGQDMQGHWSHVCPRCGRLFAKSTPAAVVVQLTVSVVVAVVVVVGFGFSIWRVAGVLGRSNASAPATHALQAPDAADPAGCGAAGAGGGLVGLAKGPCTTQGSNF